MFHLNKSLKKIKSIYRRIMRIEYPNKVFLPCMAHQMNLIVGEIFKESDVY